MQSTMRARSQRSLWRTLVEPSREVSDCSERTAARLLSTLMLAVVPLAVLIVGWQQLDGERAERGSLVVLGTIPVLFGVYVLSRTGRWRIAAVVATLIPTMSSMVVFAVDHQDPGWYAFAAIGPAVGTSLLPLGWAVRLAAVNLAAVSVASLTVADIPSSTAAVAVGFNAVISTVLVTGAAFRNRVERERLAEVLARERLHESIVEGTFGGIAIVESGVVQETNQTFAELYREERPAIIGTSLDELFDAGTVAGVDALLRAAAGNAVEITATRRDGSTFDAEFVVRSVSPIGEVGVGVEVVALRDITDRKRSDVALVHAQRMESVGRLAAGIAHDTNNELLVIVSHADRLLRTGVDGAVLTRCVEQIRDAVDRVSALTRRVLVFGGSETDDPTSVDLRGFVHDSCASWRQVLGNDITLTVSEIGAAGLVLADLGSVEQVLLNLVLNARDAMDGVGVIGVAIGRVELGELAGDLPGGAYQQVTITDTGHGIAADDLPFIFDAFFTTKDETSGTGLGLHTSREIVRGLGGTLTVDSDDGGSSFTMRLPEIAP